MTENQVLTQYIKDIGRVQLLTAAEEIELTTAAQAGCDKSRERMVLANLRLVISVAKKFRGRGVALLDMISEGNTGLLHAITKFNPQAGNKFSTYAVIWIRERIQRAIINQGPTIRVPIHAHGGMVIMARTIDALYRQLGTYPTDAQIAERSGLSLRKVRDLHRITASRAVSMDDVLPEDTDFEFMERVAADDCMDTAVMVGHEFNAREINVAMGCLSSRERQVVSLRFGLHGSEHTLEEVARAIGLTRERVRQIQMAALTKMRRTMHAVRPAATRPQQLEAAHG